MTYFMLIILCLATSRARSMTNQIGHFREESQKPPCLVRHWPFGFWIWGEVQSGTWGLLGVGQQLLTDMWKWFNFLLTSVNLCAGQTLVPEVGIILQMKSLWLREINLFKANRRQSQNLSSYLSHSKDWALSYWPLL